MIRFFSRLINICKFRHIRIFQLSINSHRAMHVHVLEKSQDFVLKIVGSTEIFRFGLDHFTNLKFYPWHTVLFDIIFRKGLAVTPFDLKTCYVTIIVGGDCCQGYQGREVTIQNWGHHLWITKCGWVIWDTLCAHDHPLTHCTVNTLTLSMSCASDGTVGLWLCMQSSCSRMIRWRSWKFYWVVCPGVVSLPGLLFWLSR